MIEKVGYYNPHEPEDPSELIEATWKFFEDHNMDDKTILQIVEIIKYWESI